MWIILPILSAVLGTIACSYIFNFSFLGLFFLIPLFIFYVKESKLKKLIWGTLAFRVLWNTGTAFSLFDPILFILLSLIFLGLPICIYFIKKISGSHNNSKALMILLFSLPFLWTFWEYLQARFNFIPSFIVTSGNILGSSNFLGLAALGGYPLLIFFCAITNTLATVLMLNSKRFKLHWRLNLYALGILIVLIFSAGYLSKIQLQKNALAYQAHKNILKVAAISNNESFDENLKNTLFQNHWEKIDIPVQAEINQFLKPLEKELLIKEFEFLLLPEHFIDLTTVDSLLGIEGGKELTKTYQWLAQKLRINLAVVFVNYQKGREYNSTFLFNKNGLLVEIYNKRRLMITGEVFPLKKWRSFYGRGKELKILKVENVFFTSAMCSEIHYPSDMKKAKKLGAQFIALPASNRWAGQGKGLKEYLFLVSNLRKITAVWFKIPILVAGRNDYAGIYLPDGKTQLVNFENPKQNRNYGIFFGEIKY